MTPPPTCDVCKKPVYPGLGQVTADTVLCQYHADLASNPGTVTVRKDDDSGDETLEWVDVPTDYQP